MSWTFGMGWSGALTTLGIASLIILIPLAMLMREPPAIAGANTAGGRGGSEDPRLPLPVGVLVVWMSAAATDRSGLDADLIAEAQPAYRLSINPEANLSSD